ncbi:hypothetical protein ABJI51_11650 [Amycolatopsis sp. NEAU-NG30]|uniref:Uncharacterized protein n=1 Tax=Amycolatopsis melonis TaxID=3156488 RepID=A0ABV0LBR9_9PSEU
MTYPQQPGPPGQPYPGQQPYPAPSGGFPAQQPAPSGGFPAQQPYPAQPYPGQPYPGQPYPAQPPYPGGYGMQPPKPSGVTAIIAGVLAVLGGLLYLIGLVGGVVGIASGYTPGLFILLSIQNLVLTGTLLPGGILLFVRKPVGRILTIVGSSLAILLSVVSVVLSAVGVGYFGVGGMRVGGAFLGLLLVLIPAGATLTLAIVKPTALWCGRAAPGQQPY